MRELVRTNDVVLLSRLSAMLAEAGIDAVLFDTYMSMVEGNIGAFPQRIMVRDEDYMQAERLLRAIANPTADA